jgi:hypothetical protein
MAVDLRLRFAGHGADLCAADSDSGADMIEGYQLKRPCKNCPFAPTKTRIKFACAERAEEIAESAYRNGFPCHLSAVDTSEYDENGGYVFGPNTQHCVGAILMFLSEGYSEGWPGIGNEEELADRLASHVDWTAPHYESEEDFIKANARARG